jgi:hypothetical protein
MIATIDRERLAALKAREDDDFVARHPRSRELLSAPKRTCSTACP